MQEYSMAKIATTKMSSKGQVVIPEDIRKRLGLESGSQFVVVGERDTVILKTISPPKMEEFDTLIGDARKQARRVGLKRSDVKAAVSKVRAQN
jgi:AbrB family looped-hinge helix DNA binding protein